MGWGEKEIGIKDDSQVSNFDNQKNISLNKRNASLKATYFSR